MFDVKIHGADADSLSQVNALLNQICLKTVPSDFCVTEILALPPETQDSVHRYRYYRLKKSGFTTFEAIAAIANYYKIDSAEISYCGLKDEDGVTDQMIAIPFEIAPHSIADFNDSHSDHGNIGDQKKYISLVLYGIYNQALQVGELEGNAFRIIVRNVPQILADRIRQCGRVSRAQVVNFYDTQRFGTPNSPKTTHLMGEALLNNDYEKALDILRRANTPESKSANSFAGSAAAFFAQLDRRVTSFYMSAYSSFYWNASVVQELEKSLSKDELIYFNCENIPYALPKDKKEIPRILGGSPSFKYRRYAYRDGQYGFTSVDRPTFYNVAIRIEDVIVDKLQPDTCQVNLAFSLPSGTYATNVVTQALLGMANIYQQPAMVLHRDKVYE